MVIYMRLGVNMRDLDKILEALYGDYTEFENELEIDEVIDYIHHLKDLEESS